MRRRALTLGPEKASSGDGQASSCVHTLEYSGAQGPKAPHSPSFDQGRAGYCPLNAVAAGPGFW